MTAILRRPRIGFLGTGWIGCRRLTAIAASGLVELVAVADASLAARTHAASLAPGALSLAGWDELAELQLDGVVIATPSALHAAQAEAALATGCAVFCQKPLARTGPETERVLEAARSADRLLGVDFSYRHTQAMRAIRQGLHAGDIGEVYAVDLVFHNAYGPDKAWFRDPLRSGGGCVIDLGVHLVDLALWALNGPVVEQVSSRLYAGGRLLGPCPSEVEDFAVAELHLQHGVTARLACSWNLAAGRDAVIEVIFHGRNGGLCMRNVNGSFLDFVAERYDGTQVRMLATPPDDWGGRAAVAWVEQLAAGAGFDPAVTSVVRVAQVLDRIYGR